MPVTMAGIAAGSSTWIVVSQRVSPMARPASRCERGTSSSACWQVRTRIGMLNIVSATAPAMTENPQPMVSTKNKKPNRPTTIEGSDESVSMIVFATLVTQFSGAYCDR